MTQDRLTSDSQHHRAAGCSSRNHRIGVFRREQPELRRWITTQTLDRPCEQIADLFIANLIEVLIPQSNGPERLGSDRSDTGISDRLKLLEGGGSRGWYSNDDFRRMLPSQGSYRGPHGRSGRKTVVDQKHGEPRDVKQRTVAPVEQLAASQFHPLPHDLGFDHLPRDLQSIDHLVIDDHNATGGDRPHRQLFLSRRTEFPHHENVERDSQFAGDLVGYGHSATRQPQNYYVGMAREGAQAFRQNAAGLVSVCKRPVHGNTSIRAAPCPGTPRKRDLLMEPQPRLS